MTDSDKISEGYKAAKSDSLSRIELDTSSGSNISHNAHNHDRKVCEQLQNREKLWWQARQRLIDLKERQVFWFGDNSMMMWLLWQLVSYVIVALLLMLASKALSFSLSLEQYLAVFSLQTAIFITAVTFKRNLARFLQYKIYRAELKREQSLNEMIILAADSVFPNVHIQAPISLQSIYENNHCQIRLVSLYTLLDSEVRAGTLVLQQQTQADVLPLELAEDELNEVASEVVYRSVLSRPSSRS